MARRSRMFEWLVTFLLVTVLSTPVWASSAVTVLGYTIEFQGVDYNYDQQESTWRYHVGFTGNGKSSDYRDLSNFSVGLCGDKHKVLAASHGQSNWDTGENWDFTTFYAIKWDVPLLKTDNEGTDYWFTLKGLWSVKQDNLVAVKVGSEYQTTLLPGPSCESACHCSVSATTRADWRIRKSGVYASTAMEIDITSQTAVRLRFEGFTDLIPDSYSAPVLRVDYSIGDTIAQADAFGWKPAGVVAPYGFDGLEMDVPLSEVLLGAKVIVWNRIHVEDATYAQDYTSSGSLVVKPLCGNTW